MGLLERMERRQAEMDVPKDIHFEYESMTDEMKKEILHFWKRLFLRGVLGAKEEYSENSNICVRDTQNDIVCFRQGKTKDIHYYGLIINNEMWSVSGILDKKGKNDDAYLDVEVLYIPSKIGKVSKIDDKVLAIARTAVDMLRSENLKGYVENLTAVLSEDCVREYTEMRASWYEQIFEDENCRQLRDYRQSKLQTKKELEKVIEFEYELVTEEMSEIYQSVLSGKVISSRFLFAPKICVKAKDEEMRGLKYLKKENLSDNIQYYVILADLDLFLVGATENKETGNVSIEKISIFGEGEYNDEVLKKTSEAAILKIQEAWYSEPGVKCSDMLHIERCAYNKQIEI